MATIKASGEPTAARERVPDVHTRTAQDPHDHAAPAPAAAPDAAGDAPAVGGATAFAQALRAWLGDVQFGPLSADGPKPCHIPRGTYRCAVADGGLFRSRKGCPGYCVSFRLLEGPFRDEVVRYPLYLTPRAAGGTAFALWLLGLREPADLWRPPACGGPFSVRIGANGRAWGYTAVQDFGPAEPGAADVR